MPAADATPRPCAIADALELIGERWSLLVVRELFWGNHRFSEIARRTGAPRDILSTRLRRLVDAGVLEKRPYSNHPPRAEYHLTPAGRSLAPVLMSIQEWALHHLEQPEAGVMRMAHGDHEIDPVSSFACRTCGKALPKA
ncbi:MAG TPA: helix-turn-helix domain-containing protein [Baekduia sp.]|uniref:winged helix-turn-helix transcriptional regulator n=1 Tax=Baekduia sp. TaxID=2600305 RepID=UPI002BA5D5AF|nr:helix-turn-helix domain-containing protein [Baekduia sp.]HMJ34463.1 helix-turn-helix domain-containing protein [Baekduia sp.]